MSMEYWGITLYGVNENDLNLNETDSDEDRSFSAIMELYNDDEHSDVWDMKLDNGKIVPLYMEIADDNAYLGMSPIYPWNIMKNHAVLEITKEDVANAIVKFLKPFNYDKDAIYDNCDYISSYNCC